MKERFESRTFKGQIKIALDNGKVWIGDKYTICQHIVSIVESYGKKGYSLSLRQLYYQLVSRELIPNHDKVYKKIGSIKDDLAYSGQLDWDLLEDRGRLPFSMYTVKDIKDALQDTYDQYRLNRQNGQETIVEVWTEKDAISNIIKRATNHYGTLLCINKGYTSSSAIYSAYQRFSKLILEGKKIKIMYLGDHDSSGLDMLRDIEDRLMMMLSKGDFVSEANTMIEKWWSDGFNDIYSVVEAGYAPRECLDGIDTQNDKLIDLWYEGKTKMWIKENDLFEIVPIGLTKEQINLYNPPPNPAKITDPRAAKYIKEHGQISWEVDALTPEVIVELVSSSIEDVIDMELFESVLLSEANQKEELKGIIANY